MKVDDAIAKLMEARKRLDEPQGRIARRNARQAYLAALRSCRKAVDDEYPVMRKPITNRRKPNPRRAVKNKQAISQQTHRQLLAAGVKPSSFIERGKAGDTSHKIYAPKWMVSLWKANLAPKEIAACCRSIKKRRRALVIARLGGKQTG